MHESAMANVILSDKLNGEELKSYFVAFIKQMEIELQRIAQSKYFLITETEEGHECKVSGYEIPTLIGLLDVQKNLLLARAIK